MGKIDLTAMYKITTAERMLQNLVYEYEKLADPRLPACSRKTGQLLETCCTIMDLKGVGIISVPSVYGYLRQASAISQNYYPERLGKLYLINAPWGFSSVFSVVKGFLDPVTVDKIHVLGFNYKMELLEQVPAENLPVEFGGTCECEGGCQLSDMGPWHEPEWTKPSTLASEKSPGTSDDPTAATTKEGTEGEAEEGGETEADPTGDPIDGSAADVEKLKLDDQDADAAGSGPGNSSNQNSDS
jgi:CRAL/TRIO domain